MTDRVLLKGGELVDPLKNVLFTGDLKTSGTRIAEVAERIAGKGDRVEFDVSGKYVMPGLVDTHTHIARCPDGHHMLAKAGVTTALDMAGTPKEILKGFRERGAGLTLGYLYPLIPGKTLSGVNPPRSELAEAIDFATRNGALGVKTLGGHYPITRDATRTVIELAHARRVWVAAHAGTVETTGDIRGLEELVQLAGDCPVHIAHINSYCRGGDKSSPLEEAARAIAALQTVPRCRSESYLAMINGTSGEFENGAPKSEVTRCSLRRGGYAADLEGMKKAILEGWAKVHYHDRVRREVLFPGPKEALAFYLERDTNVMLSFAVNSPLSAIPLALAKNARGEFIVNALSTDGGEIPRNVTLRQGLCLTRYGAMTPNELALKACLTPARILGLDRKGGLSPGMDADIVVVDPLTAAVELVIAEGQIIVRNGEVLGKGGRFVRSAAGQDFFDREAIPSALTEPEWLSV